MAVVAIAGSRALPPGAAPRLLVRFLASLPSGSTVLLRRGLFTQPNIFEAQVEAVCDLIGLSVEWCQPQPIPPKKGDLIDQRVSVLGRRSVWARDVDMIEKAELVLTFVDSGQIDDSESGTVNLTEKAIEHDKVVYAYSLYPYLGNDDMDRSGYRVQRIGENDPDGVWAELVPEG